MSPPIFNPDGPEVNEIVLPDGATASEVIGPDGNVVFEAGPDIPDSVDYYWPADEGSGTTLAPDRGTVDISLFNDGTWDNNTKYVGDTAATFETDDYYQTAQNININGSAFTVGKWLNYSSRDDFSRIFWTGAPTESNADQIDGWGTRFGITDEELIVEFFDSGAKNNVATISNALPANTDLLLVLAVNGDSADIYVWDASTESYLVNQTNSASRGQTADAIVTGMAGDSAFVDGVADAIFGSEQQMTQSEIETFRDRTRR